MSQSQAVKLNKTQARAVECFRAWLESDLDKDPSRGDALSLQVTKSEMGQVWVEARTEMLGLPVGNLLRAVSSTHWFVAVGDRGSLTAWAYPSAFKQFAGRRVFGVSFKKI